MSQIQDKKIMKTAQCKGCLEFVQRTKAKTYEIGRYAFEDATGRLWHGRYCPGCAKARKRSHGAASRLKRLEHWDYTGIKVHKGSKIPRGVVVCVVPRWELLTMCAKIPPGEVRDFFNKILKVQGPQK